MMLETPMKCLVIYSRSPCCHSERHLFSFEFDNNVISFIVALFFRCPPFAIFRVIWSVIIFSFNGMFRGWSCSHVLKEINEFFPSFTHLNSTPSIIGFSFYRTASHKYSCPYFVFRGFGHSVSFFGYLVSFGELLSPQASARTCSSSSEIRSPYNGFISTITKTKPHGLTDFIDTLLFNNSKPSKPFSSHIDEFHSNIIQWCVFGVQA